MAGIEGMQRPTADDVRAAAERIHGFAVPTPLLENADLNAELGGRLFIKPETCNARDRSSFAARSIA